MPHTRQCELFAMSEADVEVFNRLPRPSTLSADGLTSLPCGCKLSCKQDDEDVGWSRLSRLSSCAPKWMMWWNLIRLLSGLNQLIAVHTCSLLEGFWKRVRMVGCCGASRSPTWLVVHFKISNTYALSCVRTVPLKIASLLAPTPDLRFLGFPLFFSVFDASP